MFSKEEYHQLKIQFWQELMERLDKKRNPFGSKVSWANYNTRVKGLFFRMEADEEGARLCIDLQFKDDGVREVFYEQFQEFQDMLNQRLANLQWYESYEHSNGLTITRIAAELNDVRLSRKDDWPKMHEFFIRNFTKLDAFWVEFGEVFQQLN